MIKNNCEIIYIMEPPAILVSRYKTFHTLPVWLYKCSWNIFKPGCAQVRYKYNKNNADSNIYHPRKVVGFFYGD